MNDLDHRSIAATTLAVLTALSLFACGDDDGDDAPTDAGPRADTTLPDGARPDAGPDVDAADDDASSPVDGGGDEDASADAGPPPAGALDPARVLRAAVLWGSCVPDDGINRFLAQTYGSRTPDELYQSREAIECLAASTDGCAATERCLGVTFTIGSPEGCAATCEGDRLTVCDDSWHFAIDCAHVGLRCDAEARECVPRDGEACDPETAGVAMCGSDGRPATCDGDGYVRRGPACQDFGLECTTIDAIDEDGCVGRGGACETDAWSPLDIELHGVACADGATLDVCINGGLDRVTCADVATGFSCQSSGGAAFCGLASECVPGSEDERCDGDALIVCNAGREERIDCAALGFTRCAPGPMLGITAGCT